MKVNTISSNSNISTNTNQKVQNDKQQSTTNEAEEQQEVDSQQSVYVNISPEAEEMAVRGAQGNDGGGHPTRPPKNGG